MVKVRKPRKKADKALTETEIPTSDATEEGPVLKVTRRKTKKAN